ncbi:hypothetical protein [Rasiella sp. SM2506]|uniref:hypothetical protein n=1 Tax=Rasiella sp. SM2506 TaxID=3423914 RepID=UPI003D78DBF0
MKKGLLILTVVCISLSVNAQVIKDVVLKDKPKIVKLNLPNADPIIMEIINGADEGTFKISMASLTLTKYVDTRSPYVGSTSYSIVSSSNKFFSLSKYDALTAEGSFFVNGSRSAANVRIYTTRVGGQKMTIRHTEGVNTDLITLSNLEITKKGIASYIITGDSKKDGNITNYIFNVYRHVIQ